MDNIIYLIIVIIVSALVTISSIGHVINMYYRLSREIDYALALQNVCGGSVMEDYTVRDRVFKYMNSNKIFSTSPKVLISTFILPIALFIIYILLQYDWRNTSYMSVTDKLKKLRMPVLLYFIPFMYLLGSIIISQKFYGLIYVKTLTEYSNKRQTIIKYLDYLKNTNIDISLPTYKDYTSLIDILRKRIIHIENLESYTDANTIMSTITSERLFDYIKFINISMQNITPKQIQIINIINLLRNHTSSVDNWKRNKSDSKETKPLVDMKWTSSLSPEENTILIQTVESFRKDEVNNYEVINALQKLANPDGQNNDYQYLYNLSYNIPTTEESINEKNVKDALIYLSLDGNGNPSEEVKARITNVSYFVYSSLIVTSYIIIHLLYKVFPNPMSSIILCTFVFGLVFIYLWIVNFIYIWFVNFMSNV